MLWAHRMLFPIKEGKKKDKAPVYQIVADRIGRTNTACRIMLHHVKYNVEMGAISLEDALAAKRLPLIAPKKVREQAAEKGAVSRKRAPSRKKAVPVPASKAREQAAAEKKACSSKDALADKPLPGQASKPQKQTPAETRDFALVDAPSEKPPSGLTPKLQQLTLDEQLAQYRSPEGERVLEAAHALVALKMQEQVPSTSTSPRRDSFVAGMTFGRMIMPGPNISPTETVEDRSISSTEMFLEHYVGK